MPSGKLIIFLLTGWLISACSHSLQQGQVTVAFYNCENFFDTSHNPGKEDEDFTPEGKYHYSANIYQQKVHNIASVLRAMGSGDGPTIIGLAEVENTHVLADLVHQPELANRNYKYEWFDGPDPRGINVAFVYDPLRFVVLHSEPLHVDLTTLGTHSLTRDVLCIYGILDGDTVHVLVNHWPSRRGSEDASSEKREIVAGVDRRAIDSIVKNNPVAKIILMGDLNDNPVDASVVNVLGAKAEPNQVNDTALFDPFIDIYKNGGGTESFQHQWNLFDQVMVSRALLQNANHKLHYDRAEVFKPGFIVDHHKGHDGEPHRSFAGTHWINGYSDHYPVILYLAR